VKTTKNLDDAALVSRAKAGDGLAFTQLVEKYRQPVYNLCYHKLGNAQEAEDATQETFTRAYFRLDTYNEAHKFSTWLFSIAAHYCIDRLRLRHFQWVSLDESPPLSSPAGPEKSQPEAVLLKQEARQELRELLNLLPSDYRVAVILKYWHYQSYRDIAQTLHTSVSAIKSKLFRARRMMAQATIQ